MDIKDKKYRSVGVTYSLNKDIISSKDSSSSSKTLKINSFLPENLKVNAYFKHIVKELVDKGEITTQDLQKTLKITFNTAVTIGENLRSLGIIKLDIKEKPKRISWRLTGGENEWYRINTARKERVVQQLWEEQEKLKTTKDKPSIKLADLIDHEVTDSQMEDIQYNVNEFKGIIYGN